MTALELLDDKGHSVLSVSPETTILDAVRTMTDAGIGAVLVLKAGELVGILTERDVLRAFAKDPTSCSNLRVSDRMTTKVVTGTPDDDVDQVMALMTARRFRHLPILSDGRVAGILSIGDVLKAKTRETEKTAKMLEDYIRGGY